jgi:selenocysteine lyase/cysteine desulfurase
MAPDDGPRHEVPSEDGARAGPLLRLLGDGLTVPCLDGEERPYLSLDAAASTAALPAVLARVEEFLPWYSSIHRGAGYKSQRSTVAYEEARADALRFAGRDSERDVAIICRNTTEALNILAHRLRFEPGDVVVTTVVEHHANLLPWRRVATCRYVECGPDGTFGADDVEAALERTPRPKLLAVTAASNITGWSPPLVEIVDAAHRRGVPVAVDGAQMAAHRPLPSDADFVAWSGHKMYAPFGAGILAGPRHAFTEGEPFVVGGGAVDLVDLDDVAWTGPPDREEAGSPNVIGAVALGRAVAELDRVGWPALGAHDRALADRLRRGLAAISGVRLLGPDAGAETLPVATFVVDDVPHALVSARLSLEHGIGVRHGCFCAHPYLVRLLGLSGEDVARFRAELLRGDRRHIPGAVRASAGVNTTGEDLDRFLGAVEAVVAGEPPPVAYHQDPLSGDFSPDPAAVPWLAQLGLDRAGCSPG